jgi:mRNA interferase MazF
MKRGDIVLVQLPRPAGQAGHEQFGKRPAIVIQGRDAIANLSTVVIVPLTSTASAVHLHGSFVIQPDRENGLDVDSVVLTHQVRAIDKRRVETRIGTLSVDDLSRLELVLRPMLGL